MSKRSMSFARDVQPGDVIRLVYEIEIEEMGDLDTKFPSESEDLFFISGKVVKGPLHKKNVEVEFAISGDDKITVVKRKSFWKKVRERFSSLWSETKQPDAKAKLPGHKNASGVAKDVLVYY